MPRASEGGERISAPIVILSVGVSTYLVGRLRDIIPNCAQWTGFDDGPMSDILQVSALKAMHISAVLVAPDSNVAFAPRTMLEKYRSALS